MKLSKYLILAVLLISSVPLVAQARFSLKHELNKIADKKLTNKQLDNKCGINNPRIKCWTRFANNKNNVHAQYMLGTFFYNGNGVHRNRTKAFVYFKKASYNNNGQAQVMVARMFQKGQAGLQRSKPRAFAWYTIALQNHKNNQNFVNKVKRLRRKLANQMGRRGHNQAKKFLRNLRSKIK